MYPKSEPFCPPLDTYRFDLLRSASLFASVTGSKNETGIVLL